MIYAMLSKIRAKQTVPTGKSAAQRRISGPCSLVPDRILLLHSILQQILQLRHEFLHVLKIHINTGKPHIRDFIELFQPMHDHLADFRGGQFAFRRFVYHAFDFIHNRFQLRRSHRPLFASLQQSLQNLLPLKSLPSAIFLDHHVRNLVDPFIRGESPLALQALPPPPYGVASAPFARINYLVIQMPAKRTLHAGFSPPPPASTFPCAAISSNSSLSCSAISFNCPSQTPSRINSGIPAIAHPANVTSHSTIAATNAWVFSTPKIP